MTRKVIIIFPAEEKALIVQLSKAYDSLVLVINTGGLVDPGVCRGV